MSISRGAAVSVQYMLDEWVPPRLRDSKWFMWVPMKLVLRGSTRDFLEFKDWLFTATPEEFAALYRRTSSVSSLQGETDLNQECLDAILDQVQDRRVLEVGCGRGLLAGRLAEQNDVTACDILIDDALRARYPAVTFEQASIEALPYASRSFDAVVCTHTLEHVIDLPMAVSELRRVAAEDLVIVVPRQRAYKYGFNLHTQFFPYQWSVENAFGMSKETTITRLGDWYYHDIIR